MIALALTLSSLLCVIAVFQIAMGLNFALALGRTKQKPPRVENFPKVAIVLCLRGADPYLKNCLRAVLDQDYPDFEVRVVVDNEDDPAAKVVRDVAEDREFPRVIITVLDQPAATCSLKCSSLVQAIRGADDSIEVFAFIDADAIPHPTWLRELVAPLGSVDVAVTTGNRWYMPAKPDLGSLTRYTWNVAAAALMYRFKVAWGGTLAIKRSAIVEADLLSRWGQAFCEDTMLYRALKQRGLRQVFVPSLMMVNTERCTVSEFASWAPRQMLTVRLYHPMWGMALMHGLGLALVQLLSLAAIVAATMYSQSQAVTLLLAGFLFFEFTSLAMCLLLERAMRQVLVRRGQPIRWITPAAIAMLPVAILATQLVYPLILLKALFMKRTAWRGVWYRIGRPRDIRLEKYEPYQATERWDLARSL